MCLTNEAVEAGRSRRAGQGGFVEPGGETTEQIGQLVVRLTHECIKARQTCRKHLVRVAGQPLQLAAELVVELIVNLSDERIETRQPGGERLLLHHSLLDDEFIETRQPGGERLLLHHSLLDDEFIQLGSRRADQIV